MKHILHTHPGMEHKLNVPDDHVIVDKKILNSVINLLDNLNKKLEEHRKKSCCEEICFCWDVEQVFISLEIENLKKVGE